MIKVEEEQVLSHNLNATVEVIWKRDQRIPTKKVLDKLMALRL